MQTINTEWFRERLEERKLSARGLARKMKLDPASVSYMLRGKRRMTAAEANTIATILGVPTTEVLRQAGVPVNEDVHTVMLTAVVGAHGQLKKLTKNTRQTVPPDVPADGYAIQVRSSSSPADGWLILCASQVLQPETALGRLAVIHLKNGERVLGTLRKGYEAKSFNVVQVIPAENVLENQVVVGANAVLWIRPR